MISSPTIGPQNAFSVLFLQNKKKRKQPLQRESVKTAPQTPRHCFSRAGRAFVQIGMQTKKNVSELPRSQRARRLIARNPPVRAQGRSTCEERRRSSLNVHSRVRSTKRLFFVFFFMAMAGERKNKTLPPPPPVPRLLGPRIGKMI